MIKILINEINDMKEKNNKSLNELMKMNKEKEKKINILENKYIELKEKI